MTIIPGAESPFLVRLFDVLNARRLQYAVMRNHMSLPYSAAGSDLDILCSGESFPAVRRAVNEAAAFAGGVCIGEATSPDVTKINLLGKGNREDAEWWGLKVDLFPGFCFLGLPLLADDWGGHRGHHNDVCVLAEGLSGVLGLLKEILHNTVFSERYAPNARKAFITDASGIRSLLAPLGVPALDSLERLLNGDVSVDQREQICQKLRRAVIMHNCSQQPVRSLMRLAAFQRSKVTRYSSPSGLVVAVLGVDGAGKSTVIEAIRPVMDEATHNALSIKHLRPGLLPSLGRLKGGGDGRGSVSTPHGQRPSGVGGSLIRLVYLLADYIFGYWLLIRPEVAKSPNIIIFDRYAYDMALDPLRFRVSLPPIVIQSLIKVVPRPDLIICLHGSAEVIAERKFELSIEETSRQIAALKDFAARSDVAVLISTSQSIAETRDQVLKAILDFLKTRRSLAE